MCNYLRNLVLLARSQRLLRPLVALFHLTGRCNLNCAYCEDYGARRQSDELAELGVLSLPDANRVLTILRQATPSLTLTGGEPLLYPEIDTLIMQAKRAHHFHHLTLLTNGLLLSRHQAILPYLDRLVISLDSLDTSRWGRIIGQGEEAAATIIANIIALTAPTRPARPEVVLNCVITPETLADAGAVLDFCVERQITFACSPQSFNNWPRYELLVTKEYHAFVNRVIASKKRGQRILGSLDYLHLIRDFLPYNCYPTLVLRVLPDGSLIYPCRPIERARTAHGGRPCNLLNVRSWQEAVAIAENQFGTPPQSCVSCFQQCYAEPSLMQSRPLSLLYERLRFPHQPNLLTFAPG